MSRKREIVWVTGLFILTMVVSALFWSLLPDEFRNNQSTDYLNHYEPVAQAIAAGRPIDLNDNLYTRYPPGFSILLAGSFSVGSRLGADDATVLLAFRLLFAGVAVVLVYALARLIWSPNLALIPALAWMTYPFFLWLTKQPNSEVPFIPFLYASLFLFWLALLRRPRSYLYLGAGLLAGATMLIRPSAIGLGVVMAGIVLILPARKIAFQARTAAAALVLLGNFLAVLPWESAVFAQTGDFIPLGRGGAITIADGLTFLAVPKEYRRDVAIPEDVRALMLAYQDRRGEMASTGDSLAIIIDEARQNPVAFTKLMLIKAARSWYGIDSRNFELPTILLQIVYLSLVAWGSYAAFRLGGDPRRFILGIWVIVLYFWVMTILVIPLFRYMTPVMGLLMIALPGVYLSLQARRRSFSITTGKPINSDY
jgi:4-amino-4-deoxy-L-arabinose transferase-like glycosyltransferase